MKPSHPSLGMQTTAAGPVQPVWRTVYTFTGKETNQETAVVTGSLDEIHTLLTTDEVSLDTANAIRSDGLTP